jgi:hypothetical protein
VVDWLALRLRTCASLDVREAAIFSVFPRKAARGDRDCVGWGLEQCAHVTWKAFAGENRFWLAWVRILATTSKADLEYLKERFESLLETYSGALDYARRCESPDERRCFVQEMRAITDEAKSIALEYRAIIRDGHEALIG